MISKLYFIIGLRFGWLWKCHKCGELYKPTKGEKMRLKYWGASGVQDNHSCKY